MWNAIRRSLWHGLIGLALCVLALSVAPTSVWAAVYGSGHYDVGLYNIGETQVEPPSEEPPSGSESTSDFKRSSGSKQASTSCSATKPTRTPDLFQIDARTTSLTLYFSPVLAPRDRYVVSYGTAESADQHAFEWVTDANGVITVDVQSLHPTTVYYFKVRAGNGCQPGDWSNVLVVTTGQRLPSYRWTSLPRIVSTQVTQRLNPTAVQRTEMDTALKETSDLPSAAPAAEQVPSPTQTPTVQQQQGPPNPSRPTLIERISGFFNRLFGR